MSNIESAPVEPSTSASSDAVESSHVESQDTVKYESYRKSVEAEKKARERANKLQEQLDAKENADLEASGNFQEIIDNLKGKNKDLEARYLNERKQALWKDVTGAIKTEAHKAGCINPDKLIKLFDKSDFETLQADDGQIRQESVMQLIEKAKKEDYYLFTKGNVPVMSATPMNKIEQPTLNELSKDEIIAMLKA